MEQPIQCHKKEMKILHYVLGLPPYRSGGLTKYAVDLIQTQAESGMKVSLLFPGKSTLFRSSSIRQRKNAGTVQVFELVNPALTPLLAGIKEPEYITSPRNRISAETADDFLAIANPDIIHIHTLMGLPPLLIERAKMRKIKIIFTTHDYYGICPKVNLINHKGVPCLDTSGKECFRCNVTAPGQNSLYFIRNSYTLLRYKAFFNSIASLATTKKRKSNRMKDATYKDFSPVTGYFERLIAEVDYFHFNSTIAKEIYTKRFPSISGSVINISNLSIQDQRKTICLDRSNLRIGFIGSLDLYKGFPILYKTLLHIAKNNLDNWTLHVFGNYGDANYKYEKIIFHGKFNHQQLSSIYEAIDLLVVPSICNETFGFTTLEALSFGIPTLISNTVGAKDIVEKVTPELIFNDKVDLENKLINILRFPVILENANRSIKAFPFHFSMAGHSKIITETIYEKALSF